MEKVKIYDDFLNPLELEIILKNIKDKQMKYGHYSGGKELIEAKFFSYNDLSNDSLFDNIKQKIQMITNKQFVTNRNYMHIQTFGQNGSYHIDADRDDKYTFCIYLSDVGNIEESGGDFLIKFPNTKSIMSINTKFNRGILFPSYFYHKGMAYNRFISLERLCVTWKFTLITTT